MVREGRETFKLGWWLLLPCIRHAGIHMGTSVTKEALCAEQLGNTGQYGPDVCPVLVSFLNTLVSGLYPYLPGWWELVMLGAWILQILRIYRLIYRDYFTSLNRRGPKVVGGKQAKHSFALRECLTQGRRWVVSIPKKGSSKEWGVMALNTLASYHAISL